LIRVDYSPDGADRLRNRVTRDWSEGTPPANWAELISDIGPRGNDIVITKHQSGSFHGTDLDLRLRRRGVTGIVLGGITTSMGVESTARGAYDHGYNVTFAADAMNDVNPVAHRHSLDVVFPVLGEVDTTDAIATALLQRSSPAVR
jgi:nicotinamidase-related amidase